MECDRDATMIGKMLQALEHLERCREFACLVPEVRSNLVYAREDARTPEDVVAVDGRITVVNGFPRAAGRPRFGASGHMARRLLELRRTDSTIRAGINFANTPELHTWLEAYCASRGWRFGAVDRLAEPEETARQDGSSMPWKVAQAISAAGGVVPKVICESGAVGKEPLSFLLGEDPIGVVAEVCEIAVQYARSRPAGDL
jgi:predicted fused transcriptional regulator/phosphomethylpyrimidine kinase